MNDHGRMSTIGTFVAGLLLCVSVWIVVPYNNFALNNSFISDGYLPEIVLFCLAVIVLMINPVLGRFLPSCTIDHAKLALLTGMLLFAAVIPSNGLYRFFPHCLAYDTVEINNDPALATAIRESDLPPSLFPDEIRPGEPAPVSRQLREELDPGASIPWSAWLPPLLSWGTLVVAFWVLMIGLGAIIYPQWRYNERVVFPLLRVYHAIIAKPDEGKLLPPVFRSKLFWISCGVVILLHSCNGLNMMLDEAFPKFPLSWDISQVFSTGVWANAPGFLKHSRLYFLFVGLAYFMPTRHSFSIWFTVLFFGLFVMTTRTYMPTFQPMSLYDMGCGALIVMGLGIVWLGRRHYTQVLKSVFRRSATVEDKTNVLAGRFLLLGAVCMFAWFVWAGAGIFWSLLFVVIALMVMLLVSRIVAETGITYVWIIPLTASRLTDLFPRSWMTVSSTFLQQAHYIVVNRASAVSATAMMILSLGLLRKGKGQGGVISTRKWMWIGLTVLLLGLLIGGAVHLDMGYKLETSYDTIQAPITGRGARIMGLQPVKDLIAGRQNNVADKRFKYITLGAVIATILLFLCYRFPGWPLHPIGMIFVHSSIGLRLCISLALGWALKVTIIKYFGAKAYRLAMPVFLGLILGDMFANVMWTIIPVLEIFFGAHPGEIKHMIIFQYT